MAANAFKNSTFTLDDSATNTVVSVVEIYKTSSGTPASGIGARLILGGEDSAGNLQPAAYFDGYLTTVTSGSEQGAFALQLINAGTFQNAFTLTCGTNTTTVGSGTTTVNLWNSSATTVNAFGAATAINIGATGGLTTFSTAGTFNGQLQVVSNTNPVIYSVSASGAESGIRVQTVSPGKPYLEFRFSGDSSTWNLWRDSSNNLNMAFGNRSTSAFLAISSAGATTLSGGLAVNGGDITTSQTTFNLINATATTVNFAGGASVALNIGNASAPATFAGGITIADAKNIAVNTTTGTKIGTATTQKLGFWNATPVVQHSSTGTALGFTAGAGDPVLDDSTFTGNSGTKAYTIGDIVLALKNAGIMAAS